MNENANFPIERPILNRNQDSLARSPFVRRLVSSLLSGPHNHASGVVIGLCGPWGAGKSSILNLVAEEIAASHKNAVLIRFNPWLVSESDDLIAAFFAEMSAQFNKVTGPKREAAKQVAGTLAEYGSELVTLVNILKPGVGSLLRGGLKAFQRLLSRSGGLEASRKKLMDQLRDSEIPVVVLIDEIDRIDDREVKVIARLVRAVLDFPGVSYLLAYDAQRVEEALGGGNRVKGRNFLEKIVQFQIDLPISFKSEMYDLLLSEIEGVSKGLSLPKDWKDDEDFQLLADILVEDVISTPRDVKRTVGVFHVLRGATISEVYWVDTLGVSALSSKFSHVIEMIRLNPETVVSNPLSWIQELSGSKDNGDDDNEKLRYLGVADSDSKGVRRLISFLFPSFLEYGSGRKGVPSRSAVCFRRPLLTILRLGLPPVFVSFDEARRFVNSEGPEFRGGIGAHLIDDTLPAFWTAPGLVDTSGL